MNLWLIVWLFDSLTLNAFMTFWFVTFRIFTKYATCSTTSAIFLCYFFLFGVVLKGTQISFACNSSLKYFKLSLTQSYLIGVTVKTWNEYQVTSIKYQVSMNQWISSNKYQITSINQNMNTCRSLSGQNTFSNN